MQKTVFHSMRYGYEAGGVKRHVEWEKNGERLKQQKYFPSAKPAEIIEKSRSSSFFQCTIEQITGTSPPLPARDDKQNPLVQSPHITAMAELNALPLRLKNFFARYPPQLYSAKFTGITIPLTRREAKEAAVVRAAELQNQISSSPPSRLVSSILAQPVSVSGTASSPLSESSTTGAIEGAIPPTSTPIPTSSALQKFPPNPFLPRKNFVTGRWAGPKIGLRRQADLVKLAKDFDIEELLPPGRKSSAFKEARLLQRGLRIRGIGEGQKVKGHKWERRMGATLEKRRKAMESMPDLIREWKQKGHGRGWKKYPK